MSIMRRFFSIVAATIFLGNNYVTTATCSESINHTLYALGREVEIEVQTFYHPNFGSMLVEFGPDAGIYSNARATGYCVDFLRLIGTANYTADTYSTYDLNNLPFGAVDIPNNLDMLNWMINEYPLGKVIDPPGACPATAISWKHVQTASWKIVDINKIDSGMFGVDPCIVDYMVAQSFANGDGFVPCCDQDHKMAALLVVDDDSDGGVTTGTITNQVVIIEMPLTCDPGAKGDPHLTTWAGETYDFHGVCDLVLLQNPGYKNGLGMDIHIRTRKTRQWSYISAAIIRIGEETLEVRGGKQNSYWMNRNAGNDEFTGLTISGHAIEFQNPNEKSREFKIDLGDGDSIVIKAWHDMVRVDVKNNSFEKFAGSLGLLGSYPNGDRVARDKQTIIEDLNDFGQEWQVLATEKNLFHNIEGPQAPFQCEIPTKTALRRRLSSSMITIKAAEGACAHIKNKEEFELCVFDVMATNDENVALAY